METLWSRVLASGPGPGVPEPVSGVTAQLDAVRGAAPSHLALTGPRRLLTTVLGRARGPLSSAWDPLPVDGAAVQLEGGAHSFIQQTSVEHLLSSRLSSKHFM